jgi:hypothetical protein
VRTPARAATALIAATLTVGALAGCGTDGWERSRPAPQPVGALGAGFRPASAPAPESTINPVDGSWGTIAAGPGYRVALVRAGNSLETRRLVSAVRRWADQEGVGLRIVNTDHDSDPIDGIVRAMEMKPDLVMSAGNALVDPLATVTANHLDQHFLVLGAEVAEPTANVTAVDWTGASFRGEGLGTPSEYDPASFTADRCAKAVRAGVAAVLSDLTGIVVWIA